MSLPRFMVLKSNNKRKHLRYIHEAGEVHGFLQFSGGEMVSPYVKHEVELSKSATGVGLVHIRCCYNNKYWRRESSSSSCIVAGADEPEEDQSKWSCTLFKSLCIDQNARTARFLHVQLNKYTIATNKLAHDACLIAEATSPPADQSDVFTIIDWESLLHLPKHVAFKGSNGKFLTPRSIERHQYLQFDTDDIRNSNVGHEVFIAADGGVRIKSCSVGKFWRRSGSPNWIWADSDDSNNSSDTLFTPVPVKVSQNVIIGALFNRGNNNYCIRLTKDGKTDCLNAGSGTITLDARLEVQETVSSRKICNVNFPLTDARVYNKTVLTMATGVATNRTQQPITEDVKLSYTKTSSSIWGSTISLKLAIQTELKAGIARIGDGGKVKITSEFSGKYTWGGIETSTTKEETSYKVTVQPMRMVTVSLLATQGACDVPFSYCHCDTLTNGEQISYQMNDGIYTGINCFDFKYVTKEEKLI